jgi:hypothetical protein
VIVSARPQRSPWPIIIVLGLVAGLLTAGALLAYSRRSRFPSEWDPRVADLVSFVERERGLHFHHPVEVRFLDEEAYKKQISSGRGTRDEAQRHEAERAVAVLRALGMVQGDLDLQSQVRDLETEGTLAYYDPQEKRVWVRGTDLTLAVRQTLVHELTHALQDQHFELGRLYELPSEQEADAFRSVIEGDALRVEDAWAEQLDEEERKQLEEETKRSSDDAEANLAHVNDVLVASFAAPYVFGEPFVALLAANGGNRSVDEALRTPPANDGMILDPSDYLDRVEPRTVSAPDVPGDVIQQGSLGAVNFLMMLAARVDPHESLRATDAWSTDAYNVWEDDGRTCVALRVAGHGAAGADVIEQALSAWADAMPPEAGAEVDRGGDDLDIRSCDPGPGTDMRIAVTPTDVLALPSIRLSVMASVLSSGGDLDDAECVGETLIEDVSIDEIRADDPDVPELRRKLAYARSACRR